MSFTGYIAIVLTILLAGCSSFGERRNTEPVVRTVEVTCPARIPPVCESKEYVGIFDWPDGTTSTDIEMDRISVYRMLATCHFRTKAYRKSYELCEK